MLVAVIFLLIQVMPSDGYACMDVSGLAKLHVTPQHDARGDVHSIAGQ